MYHYFLLYSKQVGNVITKILMKLLPIVMIAKNKIADRCRQELMDIIRDASLHLAED